MWPCPDDDLVLERESLHISDGTVRICIIAGYEKSRAIGSNPSGAVPPQTLPGPPRVPVMQSADPRKSDDPSDLRWLELASEQGTELTWFLALVGLGQEPPLVLGGESAPLGFLGHFRIWRGGGCRHG